MVHRKSEYQNEFKLSVVKNNQPIYLENLTFRHDRRNREFLHTPICWGPQEEVEEELSSDNDDCHITKKSVAKAEDEIQYQSLAEILAESSKKNEEFRQKKGASRTAEQSDKGRISLYPDANEDKTVSRTELSSSKANKDIEINKDSCCKEKQMETFLSLPIDKIVDSDKECDIIDDDSIEMAKEKIRAKSGSRKQKTFKQSNSNAQIRASRPKLPKSSGGKPKRPDRQGRIPSSTKCSESTVSCSYDKPPFMSFGFGDKEFTLAKHRTHNVRSSCDVYDQALKAQRVRDIEKRRREREKHRAIKSASALMDRLAVSSPRDQQSWQSEYRKQFHGYEPEEYEKAASSRAVITRSLTPINAVHRGGCLIVHVE